MSLTGHGPGGLGKGRQEAAPTPCWGHGRTRVSGSGGLREGAGWDGQGGLTDGEGALWAGTQ